MIHLGFVVGTGEPIAIPLRHTAVTGQTQEAGKTTALEALISRSSVRALTFVTKRGEGAFQSAYNIWPYFRERADWQYVAAILEATLREKLKFERSWIMKVCKGAESLADVQRNIEKGLLTAKGLNESVLTTLHAYLELVLPQITGTTFASSIKLVPGVNVMDLSEFRLEMQSLIIRSAIEWVYEREDNTVVIIPEAWEFIPQMRGSPVKLSVETLIRKGAGLKNYVWLDSQDIAGVHKDILRSVPVWILGVQRESNEVARLLSHIPAGVAKPKVADVMQLGLGQFYVCYGSRVEKVYVQPAWMDEQTAVSIAKGITTVEADGKDDLMWKKQYDELKVKHDLLVKSLKPAEPPVYAPYYPPSPAAEFVLSPENFEAVYHYVRNRLLAAAEAEPGVFSLLTRRPEIHIEVKRSVVEMDDSSLRGKLVRLIAENFLNEPVIGFAIFTELKRRGVAVATTSVYRELDKLAEMGVVTKEGKQGYKKSPDLILIKKVSA
jgi:hypothetical protein